MTRKEYIRLAFEGAKARKDLSAGAESYNTIDWDLNSDLIGLRRRSGYLYKNDCHIRTAVNTISSDIVGDGITVEFYAKGMEGVGKQKAKRSLSKIKRLQDIFYNWTKEPENFSYNGLVDFIQSQGILTTTAIRDGDAIFKKVYERGDLKIQLIPSNNMDGSYNRMLTATSSNSNPNRIYNNVEITPSGKPVAYWLTLQSLDYNLMPTADQGVRVPIEDIGLVYIVDYPDQKRGVPWGVATFNRAVELKKYGELEQTRKRIASIFGGIITHETGGVDRDEEENVLPTHLEAGTITELPPGTDFKTVDPPDSGDFVSYYDRIVKNISAGFNVPYEAISGDYSKTNFSSAKMSNTRYFKMVKKWQREVMGLRYCRPIAKWFLDWQELKGIDTRDVGYRFVYPKFDHAEPLKELEALKMEVGLGLRTWEEVVGAYGKDIDEHLDSLRESERYLNEFSWLGDNVRTLDKKADPSEDGNMKAPAKKKKPASKDSNVSKPK